MNLQRRTTAAGPDDFQYASSRDRSLASGASVIATLQQTITSVPAPAQVWAAALLTLT